MPGVDEIRGLRERDKLTIVEVCADLGVSRRRSPPHRQDQIQNMAEVRSHDAEGHSVMPSRCRHVTWHGFPDYLYPDSIALR
jgi:hypothetical protein